MHIVQVKIAGVGLHYGELLKSSPETLESWAKSGYAAETLYCTAVVFPKLSILYAYLRIFTLRPYRIAVYIIGAVVVATGVAGVITSLTACRPFSARWDLDNRQQSCIDLIAYWRYISTPNIATGVAMLILPIPVIWRLKVSKGQKWGLLFVFGMGSIGFASSISRFSVFFNASFLNDDPTFLAAHLATCTMVEPGMYLIAACLPTLRPFVLSAKTKISSYRSNSGKKSTDASTESVEKPNAKLQRNFSRRQPEEDRINLTRKESTSAKHSFPYPYDIEASAGRTLVENDDGYDVYVRPKGY